MTWVFLALLSHLFWGLTNIGEKYLVDKQFKNPFVYVALGFIAGLIGLVVLLFEDVPIPDIHILLWIGLATFGYFVGVFFYMKAVQLEEVSRINLLWGFIPIYSLVGAWIFIGEKLTNVQLSAFFFLVLGGIIASLHAKGLGKFRFSFAFVLMLIGCIFFGMYDVVLRYITDILHVPFVTVFVYTAILLFIFTICLCISKKFRKDFFAEKKTFLKPKVAGLILGVNTLSKIGLFFSMWAISLAPVSLVNAMEGTQSIFVFIITIFLTLSFPHIIKEEIDTKNIILKLVAICFVVVGLVILSFAR